MFDTILIGLDGTPDAAASLPLAATLAQGGATTLVLMQVCDSTTEDTPVRRAARDYLGAFAAGLIAQGLDVISEVGHGDPATALVAAATRYGADLIMLVTHGRQRLSRILYGSVTAAVVAASAIPVLVLRADAKIAHGLRAILVPLDDSPESTVALDMARLLARTTAATIFLLRVIPPLPRLAGGTHSWEASLRCGAERVLDLLILGLRLEGIHAQGRVAIGPLATTIGAVAGELGTDLIVMGTRDSNSARRVMFRGVTDAIVRAVDQPVLLVRECQGNTAKETRAADDEAHPAVIPRAVSLSTAHPQPENTLVPGSGAEPVARQP